MSRQPRLPIMEYGKGQDRLTEKQYQRQIVDNALRVYGWRRSYHNLYAVGSDPGYPDLTMIHHDHGPLWLEIKGGVRQSLPRPEQVAWCQDLREAGLHAYVVYPRDVLIVDMLLRGEILPPWRDKVDQRVLPLIRNEEKTR